MGMEVFAFVTYVFVLLCIAMWLFFRLLKKTGKKAKAKEEKGSYDKEQRLFTLYQNIEDMLAGFEEYVEESKAETQKAKAEILMLLEKARHITAENEPEPEVKTQEQVPQKPKLVPRPGAAVRAAYQASALVNMADDDTQTPESAITPEEEPAPIKNDNAADWAAMKTADKVFVLHEKGLSKSEIAQQLSISVRGVSLALKIRKGQ